MFCVVVLGVILFRLEVVRLAVTSPVAVSPVLQILAPTGRTVGSEALFFPKGKTCQDASLIVRGPAAALAGVGVKGPQGRTCITSAAHRQLTSARLEIRRAEGAGAPITSSVLMQLFALLMVRVRIVSRRSFHSPSYLFLF